MNQLTQLGVSEAVALLRRREISAQELTRASLERVTERDPHVQAWQFIDERMAIAQAAALDSAPKGPLYGIPVGVKDIMDTEDMPTEYGFSPYRENRPAADAACVAALRRSGAVILGKTVTTQLAYFTPGKTRNPRNLEHTPGGSSSGSAAAVADFMVPIALGTQTAGSVIRPASYCGVIGFKPTFGQVPMHGIKPLAPSLDTLGVFVRNLSDLPLIGEALTGRPSSAELRSPPRVGFCPSEQWPLASNDVQHMLRRSCEILRGAGTEVDEIDLGEHFQGLHDVQKLIMAAEMARSLKLEREQHGDQLGPELVHLLEEGAAISVDRYRAALEKAEDCRRRLTTVFAKVDVLLTPSSTGEAPIGLGSTGDPVFNRTWTLLHLPCINLPVGRGARGLPLGLQLVGPALGGARLIVAAAWIFAELGPNASNTTLDVSGAKA